MPGRTDIESQLQAHIDAFVDDISAIVRNAAVEAVRQSLMASGDVPIPYRSAKPAARKAGRRKATKVAGKKTKSGRCVRRSAADLEALGARFLAHVKSHPGQRLEQIAKSLRRDTADLKRPVALLMEAKMLRPRGRSGGRSNSRGGVGQRRRSLPSLPRRPRLGERSPRRRPRRSGQSGRLAPQRERWRSPLESLNELISQRCRTTVRKTA